MNIQIGILLLSFIISVVISLIVIPILKKLKIGQIERELGPKSHLAKQGTPTMGGLIMILCTIILSIIVSVYYYKLGNTDIIKQIVILMIATIGFGVIGFLDDFKKLVLKNTTGLKPSYKMVGLLIISVVYVLLLVKGLNIGTDTLIPIIKTVIDIPIWLYIPLAIFVLLATTNAVNLTDGVDGLAATISTIIITCLTVIGIIRGKQEIIIFGSIICGSILGFLLFNLHPAKVIMGDTGSLMLGGAIASMSLYLKMPLLLIVIAIIPVLETVSVIIQVIYFKITGNRIFKMAPIHHHFELSGWNESKVVIVFSIITLIACIIGIKIV